MKICTESHECSVSHKDIHLIANKIMTFVSLSIVKPENLYMFSLICISLLLHGTHFYIITGLKCVINYFHINETDN
jgi:hypothetical protein